MHQLSSKTLTGAVFPVLNWPLNHKPEWNLYVSRSRVISHLICMCDVRARDGSWAFSFSHLAWILWRSMFLWTKTSKSLLLRWFSLRSWGGSKWRGRYWPAPWQRVFWWYQWHFYPQFPELVSFSHLLILPLFFRSYIYFWKSFWFVDFSSFSKNHSSSQLFEHETSQW